MRNYWLIRAGSNGDLWDAWKEEKVITIGWDIGEIRNKSIDEIRSLIEQNKQFNQTIGYIAGVLQRFTSHSNALEKMNDGDIGIILGPSTILGIGEIGKYKYLKNGLKVDKGHAYSRKIQFFDIGSIRIRDLPEEFQQGGMNSLHLPRTLRKIDLKNEKFDELITILREIEPIVSLNSLVDFSENSIQFYIFKNYHKLNLDIVKLEREYPTKVGFADFLCFDQIGNITVIEVKIGTANDNAVGQLLGYMNAIREETKKDVKGMLVAEGFTKRVKEAIKSDNVKLVRFSAEIVFSDIDRK